jgi:hypothetical protein
VNNSLIVKKHIKCILIHRAKIIRFLFKAVGEQRQVMSKLMHMSAKLKRNFVYSLITQLDLNYGKVRRLASSIFRTAYLGRI